MLDASQITTAEYNRLYRALEEAIYPERCSVMADTTVIRATHAALRAFGLWPAPASQN